MKVSLISHTPDALNLLLRTKNTRLKYEEDPAGWTEEKKAEHLNYMLRTIQSSWEFVEYVFQIEDVTRAFTHEFVRSRHASFAQQSMRVIDASQNGALVPESMTAEQKYIFDRALDHSFSAYGALLHTGAPPGDARGILPTNVLTSIIAKFNLRALHDTAQLRLCTRATGEYQNVFRLMKQEVVKVHPWTEPFIRVACAWNGVCIFPNFKECPIQPLTYNSQANREVHEDRLRHIQTEWDQTRFEAKPTAVGGKAM